MWYLMRFVIRLRQKPLAPIWINWLRQRCTNHRIYIPIFMMRNNVFRFFIDICIIAETVAVDCEDGNKGGCAHFCQNNDCHCPPCWVLDENGLDCVPDNSKSSGLLIVYSNKMYSTPRLLQKRSKIV